MVSRETGQRDRAAGLRGLAAWLRGVPSRLKRPESLLMAMALMASMGAHLPPYMGLGALADYFDELEAQEARSAPVEIAFEVDDSVQEPEPEEAEPEDEEEEEDPRLARNEEEEPEPKPAEDKPKPKPKPKPKVEVSELAVPRPPQPNQRLQSITQKSDDPDKEPPDARFLAEENRQVEQETVARVRSDTRDDAQPQEGDLAPSKTHDTPAADDKQEQGVDEGDETPALAMVQPQSVPRPQQEPSARREAQQSERAERKAAPQEVAVIQDPLGSFSLAAVEDPTAGRRGGETSRARRQGRRSPSGDPNIKVTWQAFEQTYSAEQLAAERARPRKRRTRGTNRNKRWRQFRAAIENYVPGVRPGNTTALNARADPFAGYIASFHRHLHREFAHRFLQSLPSVGKMADTRLVTKVEIVINDDGRLHRVGIVKGSGELMYDFGAFNAVHRGAPYPPPPKSIRSADGRVYMRWALHRNHSQCGTWNAEPYIVTNPPDTDAEEGESFPKPPPRNPSRRAPRKQPVAPPPAPTNQPVRPGETLG